MKIWDWKWEMQFFLLIVDNASNFFSRPYRYFIFFYIFYSMHFPHFAFSTLLIFSTLHIFCTTHSAYSPEPQYNRASIIRTSIIRFSWLSGLFLWFQFGHEYLLVTIKIRSHILFKTTALKGAVKCKGLLLSKQCLRLSQLIKNIRMSSDWLRVALLLGEISLSMASVTFIHDRHVFNYKAQATRSFHEK